MANWDVTTAGARLEFETSQGYYHSCAKIDDNHFINFYKNGSNYGEAEVFTVNTSTWAVSTAGSTVVFETQYNGYNCVLTIDSSHFINFWNWGGARAYAQVFAVNTSTWAVSTAGSYLNYDTAGLYQTAFQIDSNHFINFYSGDAADGFVQVFTVNTSTWAVSTSSSKLEFNTNNGTYNSCYQIDGTHFINFYSGNSLHAYAQVFTVNTSTWAVSTAGSYLDFDSTAGAIEHKCYQIDSNHFINFWKGKDADGYVQVFEVNTSTWGVTTAAARLEFDTILNFQNSCYQIDSNHFINFWGGESNDGYVQVFEVNTSTWGVTTAAARLEFDTVGSTVITNSCVPIDQSHYLNFWAGSGDDGYVQVFAVEVPAPASTAKGTMMLLGVG